MLFLGIKSKSGQLLFVQIAPGLWAFPSISFASGQAVPELIREIFPELVWTDMQLSKMYIDEEKQINFLIVLLVENNIVKPLEKYGEWKVAKTVLEQNVEPITRKLFELHV